MNKRERFLNVQNIHNLFASHVKSQPITKKHFAQDCKFFRANQFGLCLRPDNDINKGFKSLDACQLFGSNNHLEKQHNHSVAWFVFDAITINTIVRWIKKLLTLSGNDTVILDNIRAASVNKTGQFLPVDVFCEIGFKLRVYKI